MGEGKARVTWTCDRCMANVETLAGDQPKGRWSAVYIVNPPKRSVCDERIVWLLCSDCDKSLADWKQALIDKAVPR